MPSHLKCPLKNMDTLPGLWGCVFFTPLATREEARALLTRGRHEGRAKKLLDGRPGMRYVLSLEEGPARHPLYYKFILQGLRDSRLLWVVFLFLLCFFFFTAGIPECHAAINTLAEQGVKTGITHILHWNVR